MAKAPERVQRTMEHVIVIGMLAAVVLNLVQFRAIDRDARHNYRALHAYETHDVFDIAIAHDNSARRWVAPFHYFGQLFPDATVVSPAEGIGSWFPFDESIRSLGRVAQVERAFYDPVDIVDLEELSAYRVSTESFVPDRGAARRIIDERVSYYASAEPSGTFIAVTPDGRPGRYEHLAFVDVDLLDDETRLGLGRR